MEPKRKSGERDRNNFVEEILIGTELIAMIVGANHSTSETEFVTPHTLKQQVGLVVYKKNEIIPRHFHLPIERTITGTSEVILIRQGAVEVDFYSTDKVLVATRRAEQGDLVLLISGGHEFRCLEDTILLEIKQGPYSGLLEKELF